MTEDDHDKPGGTPAEHLREAERDLENALEKERAATQEIAKAENEIAEAIREEQEARQFQVEVLYDGIKKPFEVRVDEKIKHLLDQAIKAFGPLPNPHMLSLYKGTTELADSQTIKEAGVKPHDVLLLRPSKVKGGGA